MTSTFKKTYIHYIIAIILGILVGVGIQPTNGISEQGILVLAVTVPVLYLWLTVDLTWSALLYLALIIMTGSMTATEVWAGSLGHFVVITMIVYIILNYALRETGVIEKVATWFITRDIVKGHPYVFIAMFLASKMILGMVMDNLSMAVIYLGIAVALCEKLKVKRGEPFYIALFMGVMWVNVVISIASPIAHALPNILMGLASSQLGITISYGQWLSVGIPFAIVMFVLIMVIINIWRPDASCFANFDVEETKRSSPPLSKEGKITSVIFILVVLWIILPEIFKSVLPGICGTLSGWGVVIPGLLAIAALCVIHVDSKPILNVTEAMKFVPFPSVFFAGIVSLMAVPMSSSELGISTWLGNTFRPFVDGMSNFSIILIMVIIALVMTNFLSNTVTMTIFFNLGVVLLATDNLNWAAFTVLIGLAASMACVTPSSAAPSALFFVGGHITVRNSIKWNLVFIVASLIALMVFVYPFSSAIM